ncbi:MAG: hypothetical protein LBU07_06355 [Coriobacteriales bacterium]|jgi:hypothetical protein|nr:hypothetical protein [Coriobacteriales bacterium]
MGDRLEKARGETTAFANEAGAFFLDVATPNDVPELAKLNVSVKLDMAHYERTFSQGETGFARRGGFFKVMDAHDIARCIGDARSIIFTLRDEGAGASHGRIVASLWASLEDPGFAEPSPSLARYIDGNPAFAEAGAHGAVCYGRELIVARDAPRFISPGAAVFYGSLCALRTAGFNYVLSEVYRVVAYCVCSRTHSVNITNEAALRSVVEVGGLRIATNRLRTLDCEGNLNITIEPQVVLFDCAAVLQRLGEELPVRARGERHA